MSRRSRSWCGTCSLSLPSSLGGCTGSGRPRPSGCAQSWPPGHGAVLPHDGGEVAGVARGEACARAVRGRDHDSVADHPRGRHCAGCGGPASWPPASCRPGICLPPGAVGLSLDDDVNRQARRDALNARKHAITAESSSRWAGTIIRANDDQYRLARESQARHIVSLGAAISSIEKRLGQPTGDMLAREDRKTRKGPNTWPTPTLAGTSSLAGRSLPTVRPSGRPALPAASPPHRNHCPA
jgi:hypothetical protein